MATILKPVPAEAEKRQRTKNLVQIINDSKQECKESNDEVKEALADAKESHGINVPMLKLAAKFSRMAGADGKQAFADLEAYCDHLGLWDQADMLDDPPSAAVDEPADKKAKGSKQRKESVEQQDRASGHADAPLNGGSVESYAR